MNKYETCPTCSCPVTVEGTTTKHYKPISAVQIAEIMRENEILKKREDDMKRAIASLLKSGKETSEMLEECLIENTKLKNEEFRTKDNDLYIDGEKNFYPVLNIHQLPKLLLFFELKGGYWHIYKDEYMSLTICWNPDPFENKELCINKCYDIAEAIKFFGKRLKELMVELEE